MENTFFALLCVSWEGCKGFEWKIYLNLFHLNSAQTPGDEQKSSLRTKIIIISRFNIPSAFVNLKSHRKECGDKHSKASSVAGREENLVLNRKNKNIFPIFSGGLDGALESYFCVEFKSEWKRNAIKSSSLGLSEIYITFKRT